MATVNSLSNLMRVSGLGGSGLDTDSIVKQLMNAEKAPLNKLSQKKQLAQWRQDDYRSITNLLRGLKDTYFNVAKSSSNIMSASSFKKYAGTSSDPAYVTVSGSASSTAGSHTISVISLASAERAVSGGTSDVGVTADLEGIVSNYNLAGKKLQLTVDGVTREITLDNYTYTPDPASSDIISKANTGLQALLDKAFGTVLVDGVQKSKVTASFDAATQTLKLDTSGGASRITINGGIALSDLGLHAGDSNKLDIYQSLDSQSTRFAIPLTFNNGKLSFMINDASFTFDKSVSLYEMMNTINADAKANVNMKYDETTDKFTITAKQLGYGDNIKIGTAAQLGNFFGVGSASAIGPASTFIDGSDATVMIDNQLVTRNSNSFAVNGVTYNLLKAHADPDTQSVNVSLSLDTNSIFDTVKGFVDKYNEVIATINVKLGEKYDKDYQPLTDDQKADMSAEDIKKWEDKAKTGLLKNDSILQSIVYSMRQALSTGVDGVSTNLSAIGITTGKYEDQGKLTIDEAKLKAAIQTNPDLVNDLFTKKSATSYIDANASGLREKRNKEEGLAYRLSDIIDDNIRTIGGKGKLLEKAGIPGDATEFTNTIYEEIHQYTDDMADLADKLIDKENAYYARFTAMEKYIQQMSAQSSWLSQQFSSSK